MSGLVEGVQWFFEGQKVTKTKASALILAGVAHVEDLWQIDTGRVDLVPGPSTGWERMKRTNEADMAAHMEDLVRRRTGG